MFKNAIKTILIKVVATGLKVVSPTYEQGSTDMAAINSLINYTNAQYLRQGTEYRGGFFEIENFVIYSIFDPPHMMKGIKNNLLTKNVEYQDYGKKRVAKWSHIEALYKKKAQDIKECA